MEAVTQSENEATVLAVNAQNTVQQRHVKLGLQGKDARRNALGIE